MMTETQRAAMQAAHNALKTAQNAITFDDDGLWGQYKVALDSITAALAEHGPSDEPAGYTTSQITWKSPRHHSEQIVKITQRQQPEYGFTHAVFNAPQRREPLTDDEWLNYLLTHADNSVLHVAADKNNSIRMDGKWYLRADANNLRKLVEKVHGIGAKP